MGRACPSSPSTATTCSTTASKTPTPACRDGRWSTPDGDGDGQVTLAELEAVDIAPLGYTVGKFGEVRDLRQFVTHLTTTLGHIDGEGHCTTLRGE